MTPPTDAERLARLKRAALMLLADEPRRSHADQIAELQDALWSVLMAPPPVHAAPDDQAPRLRPRRRRPEPVIPPDQPPAEDEHAPWCGGRCCP